MRARITWKGDHEEEHPELGVLTPGRTIERDLAPALLEALEADGSGLFTVERIPDAAAITEEPTARRRRGAEGG